MCARVCGPVLIYITNENVIDIDHKIFNAKWSCSFYVCSNDYFIRWGSNSLMNVEHTHQSRKQFVIKKAGQFNYDEKRAEG